MDYDGLTIKSNFIVVRWLHKKRFHTIVDIVNKYQPKSLLDYGCGTGSFILELLNSAWVPNTIHGFEPLEDNYRVLQAKYSNLGLLDRHHFFNDVSGIHDNYDMITSMGVLEHLTMKHRLVLYDNIIKLLHFHGHFVVQVPVMVGIGMVLRELSRIFLKKLAPEHSLKEVISAGFFCTILDDDNRFLGNDERIILGHRGFDYRRLLEELCSFFNLNYLFFGPFNLPYFLAHSLYAIFTQQFPARVNHEQFKIGA